MKVPEYTKDDAGNFLKGNFAPYVGNILIIIIISY